MCRIVRGAQISILKLKAALTRHVSVVVHLWTLVRKHVIAIALRLLLEIEVVYAAIVVPLWHVVLLVITSSPLGIVAIVVILLFWLRPTRFVVMARLLLR